MEACFKLADKVADRALLNDSVYSSNLVVELELHRESLSDEALRLSSELGEITSTFPNWQVGWGASISIYKLNPNVDLGADWFGSCGVPCGLNVVSDACINVTNSLCVAGTLVSPFYQACPLAPLGWQSVKALAVQIDVALELSASIWKELLEIQRLLSKVCTALTVTTARLRKRFVPCGIAMCQRRFFLNHGAHPPKNAVPAESGLFVEGVFQQPIAA